MANRETLFDHQFIDVVLTAAPKEVLLRRQRRGDKPPNSLVQKKLDQRHLLAATSAETWSDPLDHVDSKTEAAAVGDMAHRICDAAMPRSRPAPRLGRPTGGRRKSRSYGLKPIGPAAISKRPAPGLK